MITIIGNLKGGTGKSTIVFNLAVWLMSQKRKVTLFDLDPQKTLSDVIDIRSEEGYEPQLQANDDIKQLANYKSRRSEVLVDVGTSDYVAMQQAILLADRIIVPVPPSQADVWSTQRFIKIVKELTSQNSKKPIISGFINRADTHRGVRETDEAEQALQYLKGIKHVNTRLYQRTAFRRSFSEGLAVFEMQPMSKASTELINLSKLLYPGVK